MFNKHVALICGASKAGKSTSLRNLENVLYANCEAGKQLPFKANNFKEIIITDPLQMTEFLSHYEYTDGYSMAVIDGLNYLMNMYESNHVRNSANTMTAWGDYAEYFKELMQQQVAALTKPIIFTAHVETIYNESSMEMETKVPVKGSTKSIGIESFFTTVVMAKKVKISDLEEYKNDLLNITDRDKKVGYKNVFQTMITADTVNTRISTPMGMFSDAETYIDNDVALLLQRMNEYYA